MAWLTEYAAGRWLATGGGGYDAFRVVPRAWSLVWLAQAHEVPPANTPEPWRERWAAAAEDYGQAPLPLELIDPPRTVAPDAEIIVERNLKRAREALEQSLRLQAAG